MKVFATVFIIFLLHISFSTTQECILPNKKERQADYYWRDYYGIVPHDAVEGGYSENGNTTYVGQIASTQNVGMFPANIYEGKKEAVAAFGPKVVDGTYVKILCSGRKNQFEWKSTTSENMHVFTDYHLVIGGVQIKEILYIGRANFEGQVQIGRIYRGNHVHKGLWLYNKAGQQINFQSFEILVLPR